MPTKFNTPNHVIGKAKDAVACCVKVLVPDELAHRLEQLYPLAETAARQMLVRREESSSKFYKSIPCVLAKSLIAKYQRNLKCRAVRRLVLPICGDKGRQVKLVPGGIRVPAIFKKEVLPVLFPRAVVGFVRQVEFFKRDSKWFASVCYNSPAETTISPVGVIGVDRNSTGNIAVLADPKTGAVRKLGYSPAASKQSFINRKKNLQKRRAYKLLAKLKRKQARRSTFENHKASKTIVAYAAIVLEKLAGVGANWIVKKQQWAFAQLESFLRYKCALRGIPLLFVEPAYTSQDCSRCGFLVCCGFERLNDKWQALQMRFLRPQRTSRTRTTKGLP